MGAATQPRLCSESLKDEQGLSHTGKQRGRREGRLLRAPFHLPGWLWRLREAQGGAGKETGDQKVQNWKRLAEHTHPVAEEAHGGLETAPVYMGQEPGGWDEGNQVYGSHPGLS